MFVVTNQLSVKPEFAEAIETAFLESIAGIEALPGFKGFRFLRPQNPETTPFLVETEWEEQAAFENWKHSEHFKASHAGMGRFREAFYAPPKMGQYTLSYRIES
jgi:heme oxygenase (mycobilin-producing)